MGVLLAVVVAVILVGASFAYLLSTGYFAEKPGVVSTEPPATTKCIIAGQPGPFFLRIISDSDHMPVAGARVTATNEPALCNWAPATNQTSISFTTNDTEWYPLDTENDAGYSLVVAYAGNAYNFTADLRPDSTTCATLYVPSGKTNVTIAEFQTTCPPPSNTTTTSSSSLNSPSDTCVYPAQSMGLFLRVLSDSGSSPLTGAIVGGTYRSSYTCVPNSTSQSTTSQTIGTFATNGTEWYSFSGINDGVYSLTITYQGHEYNLTADLRPMVYTCATVFLPSDNVNAVYRPTSCEGLWSTSNSTAAVGQNVTAATRVFKVTFQQAGACSPPVFTSPWSVTLGNETESEPSNATLPIPDDHYGAGPLVANLTSIIFSVPDGTYQYEIDPASAFPQTTGTVTVDGADVFVTLNGPVISCTTTIVGNSTSPG